MTIRDLIKDLEEFDLDKEITFIGEIVSGRQLSWVRVGSYLLEEEDEGVFLKITGNEDDDGGYEY